ncbi:tripartite tricarboxylate transporter TctB family protein [Phreatobacter aquaticus]|uniref:Tripartite tricarboxylate transporter TctB family protein n=1 Tax=Phreatobacter aquaticus TaxID=2570229 RepID=A0A4D7QM39_9HYPH|nr:tripartite tricarboxylate transporter TctB family protein [Phreatobacter aquaticus]QCK86486.1 tripartite tricarboxylate transporter TctB family protein [Phreatobacter aquaticus]
MSPPSPEPAAALPLWKRADLWAGAMFIAWGLFALAAGYDLPLGRAGRLGAGYAPRLLAFVLIGIGVLLAVRSPFTHDEAELTIAWRPLVVIVGSVLAFAALLNSAGLIVAVVASVGLASFASPDNGWRSAVVLGLSLAFFSWALFVKGLGLPIPVWMP